MNVLPKNFGYADLHEKYLPREGYPLLMETKGGDLLYGYFLWSGDYVFKEMIGDDDIKDRWDVIAWEYLNDD